MSMAYSSVYGNKVRKLWKILAKNDLLTNNSYEFKIPEHCKVRDCEFRALTAMEMFRHIREQHLTVIKHLKIKIGGKSPEESDINKVKRKPGPRSITRKHLDPLHFKLFSPDASADENEKEEKEKETQNVDMPLPESPKSAIEDKLPIDDTTIDDSTLDDDDEYEIRYDIDENEINDPILESENILDSDMDVDEECLLIARNITDNPKTPVTAIDQSSNSEQELVLQADMTAQVVTLKASFGVGSKSPEESATTNDANNDENSDVFMFEDFED